MIIYMCVCMYVYNLKSYQNCTRPNIELNQRNFNAPSTSHVAIIWLEDNLKENTNWEIIVYNHYGFSHRVEYYYDCYDNSKTLYYILILILVVLKEFKECIKWIEHLTMKFNF